MTAQHAPAAQVDLAATGSADDVRLAVSGDVAAFERLYRAHVGRVFALSMRMTGDHDRATHLTQDTFVIAWQRLGTFRGEAAFGSWLHRIAVNVMLSDARSARRYDARVTTSTAQDEMHNAATASPDVEQAVDLERAIARLSPAARTVFVLHDVEGYRHDEIARMTGVAPGTLRAQLHRARKQLMEGLSR